MQSMTRWLPLLLVALAACDAADQPHPFDAVGSEVSRTLPATGGYISTPAGAAVYVAPGAHAVALSLALREGAPEPAASGRVVGTGVFEVAPGETPLPPGSRAELKLAGDPTDSLWLASVVRWGAGGISEHGRTRVDLALGYVEAQIGATGRLAAVIPAAGAVIPLSAEIPPPPRSGPLTPAETAYLLTIDSLTVRCGAPGARCTGVVVAASDNLLGQVRRAALVFPRLDGVLRREGSDAVGQVTIDAAFRVELGAGATAENVTLATTFPIRTSLLATAFSLDGVGGGDAGVVASLEAPPFAAANGEERIWVYPPRDGEPARAVIERSVQLSNSAGVLEPARIYISFPLQVHRR